MSNFSRDSDLLGHEPMVFHELPFAGQTRLKVTDAVIDGPNVTSAMGGFAPLSAGQVAMIGDGSFAIAAIVSNNAMTLAVPPVGVSGSTLVVRTLAPQAALVGDELLRAIGLDPDDPSSAGSIVSLSLMVQLEAIGTLSRAYAGAISIAGDSRRIEEKANRYRQRLARGLRGAAIELDLDGDGRIDAVRQPGIGQLVRG